MELTTKNYKTSKIRNYVRINHTFFLFNGNTLNSNDWIITEQALKNMNFKYYKIFNKAAIKTLNKSIYQQVKNTINGITFFIRPTPELSSITKKVLFNNFEPLLLSLIALKINNKIYSSKQLKNTYSLNYRSNKLLIYQFSVTHLKFYYNFSK